MTPAAMQAAREMLAARLARQEADRQWNAARATRALLAIITHAKLIEEVGE